MLRRVRSDGCPTSGASVAAHIEVQLKKRLARIAGALAEASDKSEFSCPGTETLFLEPLPPSLLPPTISPPAGRTALSRGAAGSRTSGSGAELHPQVLRHFRGCGILPRQRGAMSRPQGAPHLVSRHSSLVTAPACVPYRDCFLHRN